jgi:hypothetical protein
MKHLKETTLQRVTVYLLVAILFAFAGSLPGVMVLRTIDRRYPNLNNALVNFILKEAALKIVFEINLPHKPVQINWAEQYPFETEGATLPVSQPPLHLSLWKSIITFASKIYHGISRSAQDHVLFRNKYVEAAAMIEKILGLNFLKKTTPAASYTILDDGYLIEYTDPVDVTACAKSLGDFNQFLQSRNIPLLYVQAPGKVCKDDEISSTRNFINYNMDNLLSALSQAGVFTLDLREEVHRQGLVHHDLFLKTDHHWKPETGLWAAKVVTDRLNASFDFNIDISLYNPECYDYRVQGDHLGSLGRRATLAVATPEPISLISPKFETDLTIRISSRNFDKRGNFRAIIYYQELWEYMSQGKDAYSKDYYYAYFYGGPIIFAHNNHPQHVEKKILVINDSFGRVVTPFLTLGVNSVDILDLRQFTGSVRSFIDQSLPDIVLVLYNPGELNDSIDYNSHRSLFDFR